MTQPNNPLHGITLKAILEELVARYDWPGLAERIPVACFSNEPSLNSSLKFLRRTDWARAKVEGLYLADQRASRKKQDRNARRAARRAYKAEVEAEATDEARGTESQPPQ